MDDGHFKQEKSSILTKLEYNKVFSLDPHRKNKKKNLHHHYQNEEEEKEKNQEFDFSFQNQDQVLNFQQPHELFSSHYQNLDNNTTTYLAQSKKRSYFPPPPPPPPHPPSGRKQKVRASLGGGGEIVEVQGGHIIRSIGRKDRHSKVCTAKGPRDRRVRLAAHTAIQFYDVQDRLGYDRPSKAVDWLIKKAKASIDELAELPPWKPTTGVVSTNVEIHCEDDDDDDNDNNNNNDNDLGSSSKRGMIKLRDGSDARVSNQNNSASSSGENAKGNGSFLPLSLDSDAISATIKSFFPMGGCGSSESNSSAMQFQSFPQHSSQSQDLKLSLQSFQDPYNNHLEQSQSQFQPSNFFTVYDAQACWPEHQHQYQQQQPVELGRLAATAVRAGGDTGIAFSGGAIAGASNCLFNSHPAAPPLLQQLFSQNQFLSQRGPLQSSYSPSIRAWIDPIHQQYQHNQAVLPMYSASGFASEVGGFSGFRIPTRIQGEIEEHDGISDKPSSASSDSRH